MFQSIKSLSLACRIIIDMHALNNEETEGNRMMTRQVGIVVPAHENGAKPYQRAVVNAISGDMNKHIFAKSLRNSALDTGLPVCEACQALDPARMMGNPWFFTLLEDKDNSEFWKAVSGGSKSERQLDGGKVTDRLLTCTVDDACGIFITSGTSVKRKSAIEFGWTIGLPESAVVQEYIHARQVTQRMTRTQATGEDKIQINIEQMVFTRPASSGVYAFVAHLDAAAIGFNPYTQTYPKEVYGVVVDRTLRMRAALIALAQTVLHPKGAKTSTQLPHIVGVEGFVSLSATSAAAPLISPLMDNFVDRAAGTVSFINRLHGQEAVSLTPFDSAEGLLSALADIAEQVTPGEYIRR